jgi:hypothetical protein
VKPKTVRVPAGKTITDILKDNTVVRRNQSTEKKQKRSITIVGRASTPVARDMAVNSIVSSPYFGQRETDRVGDHASQVCDARIGSDDDDDFPEVVDLSDE